MNRRALVSIIAVSGLGALAMLQPLSQAGSTSERPPDLRAVPASEVRIVSERRSDGVHHLLVFASATENVGHGPLLIEGLRRSSQREMTAAQLVRRSDGSYRRRRGVGTLRFTTSPDHSHWHLLRFMLYELRRASDSTLIAPDRKTGFCLGDRDPITDRRVPGALRRPVYTGNCGRGQPHLTRVREGISVGWLDDYPARLEGQHIDVTRVPAGEYLLVHRADPFAQLREETRANNTSTVRIRLRRVDGLPRVEVLARCAESAVCPR